MNWKYFRGKQGVSKWTSGESHWVTKWDNETFCHLGINGHRAGQFAGTPEEARAAIERVLAGQEAGK